MSTTPATDPRIYQCPRCGRRFSREDLDRGALLPQHRSLLRPCHGSGQYPRNTESDRRPPWTDTAAADRSP